MLFTVDPVKTYLAIASAVILPFSAMPAVAFASNNPAAVEQIQAESPKKSSRSYSRKQPKTSTTQTCPVK